MGGADVVQEGWLWKKKGSATGGLFKSVTRRYCVMKSMGVLECYEDEGGTLLTSVKINKAEMRGKWLYIRGYNDVKSKNTYLRFQGDFENDTELWTESITSLMDGLYNQSERNRGETLGMFFEDGEKRASAIQISKAKAEGDAHDIIPEEDEEEEDEEGEEEVVKVKVKPVEEKKEEEAKEEKPKAEKEKQEQPIEAKPEAPTQGIEKLAISSENKNASEESQIPAENEKKTEEKIAQAEESGTTAAESTTAAAKKDEGVGATAAAAPKTGASLWGKLADAGPEAHKKPEPEPVQKTAKQRWAVAKAKAPAKKKLYGADLLKHLAMQQVTDMKVSREVHEMERWKAKCELGDEMNPSKGKIKCICCDEPILDAYMALNGFQYHKDCFKCVICNRSVQGGAYEINSALYCEDHRLKVFPQCHRCKQNIREKYIVGPKGTLYHADCFSCKMCERKIRTYCEHENEIYCVTDYSKNFASTCTACGHPLKDKIRTLQGSEEAKGMNWHESCFKCSKCKKRLHQKVFFEDKKLLCEYCMKKSHLPSCKACNMPVEGACVNALDASWHPKCFVCTTCKEPLKGFIAKDGLPYCKQHYEDLFAKTCDLCKKPIKGGFLNALGKTFHDTCFLCCNCNKKIDGAFIKSPDDLPCCSKDCLGEYYKNVILPRKKQEQEAGA